MVMPVSGKSRSDAVIELSESSLAMNEVAFLHLGDSGVILKTMNQTVIIDPANLLKGEEIKALRGLNLLLFTHSHGDHYNFNKTLNIFKATGAPVMAEPRVAYELRGKIPPNKLTNAIPGKIYTFGELKVNAIRGIHRDPINLYQIKIADLSIFHGGDSEYVSVKDYPSELAFLPTGRPSLPTSPEPAFKMASELRSSVVVAIHGSIGQSYYFQQKVNEEMPEITVIVPEPWKLMVVTLKGY